MLSPNYTEPNTGVKKLAKPLKAFDLEFQPFIEEINAKELVIREFAGAATMGRVKSKYGVGSVSDSHRVGYNLTHISRH